MITEKQADQIICAIFNDNCLGEYGEGDVHQDVETMANEEYNKWLILYFDMQSINLQFNCNDIASSLKAQRDKIVFTSSSWWSTPVRSDVFPLTETESPVSMDKDGLCYLHN